MSFECPECARHTLGIADQIELPRDSRSDEIALQVVRCTGCGFVGLAVYEESRRGSLDSESVDHRGYRVRPEHVAQVEQAIASCPRPQSPRCTCAVHLRLGRKNVAGRWVGLDDLPHDQRFEMQL